MMFLLQTISVWAQSSPPDTMSSSAPPTEVEAIEVAAPWRREGWGWGVLPAFGVNRDEGLLLGALGSLYRYDGKLQPYKMRVTLIVAATTRGVQSHSLQIDALEVGGAPLRLTARGAFDVAQVDSYCGVGPEVTCDPSVAAHAASLQGLTGEAQSRFTRRFYQIRYRLPELRLDARYALNPMPHRVELLLGYRATWFTPGTFSSPFAYPGSLYARDFGEEERGLTSVLQAGVMLDNRDNEPSPVHGYWIEASSRAASPIWGSAAAYFGVNTTLRGYLPLGTDRLVLADRVVLDVIWGEVTLREMSTPGGSQRYGAYGSQWAGRGIRLRRFVGESFAMNQAELRWLAWRIRSWKEHVDIYFIGFSDVGFVGAESSDFGRMFRQPLPSGGAGLRVSVARNFVIRADVGRSGFEEGPSVYIDVNNLF